MNALLMYVAYLSINGNICDEKLNTKGTEYKDVEYLVNNIIICNPMSIL